MKFILFLFLGLCFPRYGGSRVLKCSNDSIVPIQRIQEAQGRIAAEMVAGNMRDLEHKILLDTSFPVATVDPEFLSVTLGAQHCRKWSRIINFTAPRILNMASALKPAMLRVGGAAEDFVIFNESSGVFFSATCIQFFSLWLQEVIISP